MGVAAFPRNLSEQVRLGRMVLLHQGTAFAPGVVTHEVDAVFVRFGDSRSQRLLDLNQILVQKHILRAVSPQVPYPVQSLGEPAFIHKRGDVFHCTLDFRAGRGLNRDQERSLGLFEVVTVHHVQHGTPVGYGCRNLPYGAVASGAVLSADVDVVAPGVDVHACFQGLHCPRLAYDSCLAAGFSEL